MRFKIKLDDRVLHSVQLVRHGEPAITFAEAVAYARATFKVAFLDEDEDYPDCTDFITHGGTVYAIEPEGFKL